MTVSGSEIVNIQSYRCTMTYSSKNYVDVITVEDKSDPYVSEMLSIGGFTVKNNLGGLVPYVIVRTNQREVDPLLGNISEISDQRRFLVSGRPHGKDRHADEVQRLGLEIGHRVTGADLYLVRTG